MTDARLLTEKERLFKKELEEMSLDDVEAALPRYQDQPSFIRQRSHGRTLLGKRNG